MTKRGSWNHIFTLWPAGACVVVILIKSEHEMSKFFGCFYLAQLYSSERFQPFFSFFIYLNHFATQNNMTQENWVCLDGRNIKKLTLLRWGRIRILWELIFYTSSVCSFGKKKRNGFRYLPGTFANTYRNYSFFLCFFFFLSGSLKYRERKGEGDEISDCLQSNGKK